MSDPIPGAPAAPELTPAPVAADLGAPVAAPAIIVEPSAPDPPPSLLAEVPVAEPVVPPVAEEAPAAPAAEPIAPVAEPVTEAPAPITDPPAITYEAFTWPEGFTPTEDDPTLKSFTDIAGRHTLPQETAQELVNLHAAEIERVQQGLVQRQFDVFADRVKSWEQEFRADPEFKNRTDTVINDAKWAIREFGGTAAQQQELRDVLRASGVGNQKAVIRVFANIAKQFREARATQEGRTTAARGGHPADRRYGSMGETTNGNR